jgi:periplasmic copper chaperone A
MRRITFRVLAVLAGATAAALAFTVPAGAHVSVSSTDATQGGYAKVTFRAPNEKDNARTVKLEVVLPADAPIASVAIRPVAGWTTSTESTKLAAPIKTDDGDEVTEAVSKITWTAARNGGIAAGQFQEFDVAMGPLPDTDQIVFKALQTYSDGEIVRWIEVPAAGAAEPENPAPVLVLSKATTVNTSATSGGSSGVAVALSIVAIVLGLAGLVLGFLAYRRGTGPSAS